MRGKNVYRDEMTYMHTCINAGIKCIMIEYKLVLQYKSINVSMYQYRSFTLILVLELGSLLYMIEVYLESVLLLFVLLLLR
jgi:hypothetical protein